MSEHPLANAIKARSGWMIGLGIVTIILGALAIGSPFVAGVSVVIVVGSLLLISGLGQCIFAFRTGSFGSGLLAFVLGTLTVVCGGMMIGHPIFGLEVLTIVLIAYLIVEGVMEVFVGIQLRPMASWGWVVVSGVVSIILGIFLWRDWPLTGLLAIGILLGIKLLLLGTWMMMIGFAGRSIAASVDQAAQ